MTKAKLTSKSTKKGIVEFLKEVVTQVADKTYLDRINYTLKAVEKNEKDVDRESLLDLAMEVKELLTPTQLAMENAIKPANKNKDNVVPLKGAKKSEEQGAEEIAKILDEADGEEEKKEEAPKAPKSTKGAPKITAKKDKEQPKSVVANNNPTTEKAIQLATQFPAQIDTELGTAKVNFDIKNMKDLAEAIESGKQLIFSCYWTKRHLAQFDYDLNKVMSKKQKEFKNDLDLVQPLYISENGTVVYALSILTEVLYIFKPEDFEIVDGMRYSNGMEYNIYEIVEA